MRKKYCTRGYTWIDPHVKFAPTPLPILPILEENNLLAGCEFLVFCTSEIIPNFRFFRHNVEIIKLITNRILNLKKKVLHYIWFLNNKIHLSGLLNINHQHGKYLKCILFFSNPLSNYILIFKIKYLMTFFNYEQ